MSLYSEYENKNYKITQLPSLFLIFLLDVLNVLKIPTLYRLVLYCYII